MGSSGAGRFLRALVRPLVAASLAGIMAGQWRMLEYRLWVPNPAAWDAQLAALGPGYAEALLAVRAQQPHGRVLVLFDGRNHLFGAHAEPATAWDPPPSIATLLPGATDPDALASALRRRGFTHVFANEAELGRILAFYARDRFAADPRGNAGVRSGGFEGELRAFPAFALLGMTPAQASVFAGFLREARRSSLIAVPVGPLSEIWLAPIPGPTQESASHAAH